VTPAQPWRARETLRALKPWNEAGYPIAPDAWFFPAKIVHPEWTPWPFYYERPLRPALPSRPVNQLR
jgi:hypothetical protein